MRGEVRTHARERDRVACEKGVLHECDREARHVCGCHLVGNPLCIVGVEEAERRSAVLQEQDVAATAMSSARRHGMSWIFELNACSGVTPNTAPVVSPAAHDPAQPRDLPGQKADRIPNSTRRIRGFYIQCPPFRSTLSR